jgi:hypothetical protein
MLKYAALCVALFVSQHAQATTNENASNPAVSLILSGTYGNLQRDPAIPAKGFAMNPSPGHKQGFNLGESEMGLSANIDPQFQGVSTLALDPAGGISVENAFVRTVSLANGFNLKFGRFFSGMGYLNEQHAHAWDFVDQPLAYATLWENQLSEDGLQLKWLAPADLFIEIGGETGKGRGYPGTNRPKNGSGANTLFAHFGGDVGIEQSWRAGVSLHRTRAVDRESTNVPDLNGNAANTLFSGDSETAGLDFVWKYAYNGNISMRYLKVQGEYFRRNENGALTYDPAAANTTSSYSHIQTGGYVQSIYQFVPRWRLGLRYDQLGASRAKIGAANAENVITDYHYVPSRTTLMLDYSPSEFSRLRVQWAQDKTRQDLPDAQFLVQYTMSLGAHGAHQY